MRHAFFIFLSLALVVIVIARVPSTIAQNEEEQPARPIPLDPRLGQIPHLPAPETDLPPNAEAPRLYDPNYQGWTRTTMEAYSSGNWDIYYSDFSGWDRYPISAGPYTEIHPDLNRGANRVLFASNESGSFQIYVVNADGSERTQLTFGVTDNVNPRWSPDGTRILFESYRDRQAEIYLMDADGSNQRRLTTDLTYDGMPAWSPDGEHFLFVSSRGGPHRIWRMELDSGELRVLTDHHDFSAYPAWSPDGRSIAYSADGDGNGWFEVWIMDADGSNPHPVSHFYNDYDHEHYVRSWSPDNAGVNYTAASYTQIYSDWYVNNTWQRFIFYSREDDPQGDGPRSDDQGFPGDSENHDWYLQWQTTDVTAPTAYFLPPYAGLLPAVPTLTWQGQDSGGAGLRGYDLQYRPLGETSWTSWLEDTLDSSAAFEVHRGIPYEIRLRARDAAFNRTRWIHYPQPLTLYEWSASGQITDNGGAPIQGVLASSSPAPFLNDPSDPQGRYSLYSADTGDTHSLSWQKAGYGQLPDTPFPALPQDATATVVLPPADNLLPEGTFEGPSLPAQWKADGDILPAIDSDQRVSGSAALRLGDPTAATLLPDTQPLALSAGRSAISRTLTVSPSLQSPRLSFLHQVYGESAGNGLQVRINGSELATLQNATTEWQHASLDVSPWQGETVTLTLETAWEEGQTPLLAWIDDLTLGSAHPDLALTMNGATNDLPGGEVTYNLLVRNQGGPMAPATQLSLQLPDELTLVSATPAPDMTGATLVWDLGEVASGDQHAVSLTLAVKPNAALLTSLTMEASVESASEELQLYNNSVQKSLSVAHAAVLPVVLD